MTKKIKNIIGIAFSLCLVLCLCLPVFAETETDSFENGNESPESTTVATSVETGESDIEQDDFDTTTASTTQAEENTQSQTTENGSASDIKPDTTSGGVSGVINVKPVKPKPSTTKAEEVWQETERNDDNNGGSNDRPVSDGNKSTTLKEEETTEEESLPEGSFYLYLERNNGERRLKLLMNGTGYVKVPDVPVREGFTFVGWFTEPEFKNSWDFYRDKASETMTFYAKWDKNPETVIYKITVDKLKHGKIEVNPAEASAGEVVSIYVTPDEGKRLVPGSLKINGKSTDLFTFTMPAGDVKISALFENAPEIVVEEKDNTTPFIVVAVILFLIVAFVVVMIIKRRKDFDPDYDPDNPDNDDEDEAIWIDEIIVVEDAFQDGVKKINEDFVPDFGTPEDDDD